jgi:coiled-coil domain-containing protein 77
LNFGEGEDMEILKDVRKTAGQSKKVMGELQHLKASIYSLENDLRHL